MPLEAIETRVIWALKCVPVWYSVWCLQAIHSYIWIARAECIMFFFSLCPIFSVSPHSLFYDEVIACSSLVNHDTPALINSVAGSLTQSKRDLELFHTCYVRVHHCSWHIERLDGLQTLSSVEVETCHEIVLNERDIGK